MPSVTDIVNAGAFNIKVWQKMRFASYVDTLAGDLTVLETFSPLLVLDPGGSARNVDLPAEATSEGLIYLIVNTADAAEDITVRNDAAGTIVTVSQNEMALVVCDGTDWHGMVGGIT